MLNPPIVRAIAESESLERRLEWKGLRMRDCALGKVMRGSFFFQPKADTMGRLECSRWSLGEKIVVRLARAPLYSRVEK